MAAVPVAAGASCVDAASVGEVAIGGGATVAAGEAVGGPRPGSADTVDGEDVEADVAAGRLGGGQPNSVGENMAPATATRSRDAAAMTPRAPGRRRRWRPVGTVVGISAVGCDAQFIRAPYDRVCTHRKFSQIDTTI